MHTFRPLLGPHVHESGILIRLERAFGIAIASGRALLNQMGFTYGASSRCIMM